MREKEMRVKCFPITDTYTRRTKSVFQLLKISRGKTGYFFLFPPLCPTLFFLFFIFFFYYLFIFFFLSFPSFFFSVERSMKIGTPFSHRAFLVSDFEYLFSGRSFRNLEIRNSRSTKNSTQWTTY